MRVRLLSDLHTEFAPYDPGSERDADPPDVVVLAGDIGRGLTSVRWAQRAWQDCPVIYVPGNHEFYGAAWPRLTEKMRAASEGSSVHVLDNDEVVVQGVRFLGSILWTDFALFGRDRIWASCEAARATMNDYRRVRRSPSYSRLRPEDTLKAHALSVSWLRARLSASGELPTIVVTHHAPSAASIPQPHRDDPLSPTYASALDGLVASSGAVAWMHGHTHHKVDYTIASTRVLTNPRGYPDAPVEGFEADFIFDTLEPTGTGVPT